MYEPLLRSKRKSNPLNFTNLIFTLFIIFFIFFCKGILSSQQNLNLESSLGADNPAENLPELPSQAFAHLPSEDDPGIRTPLLSETDPEEVQSPSLLAAPGEPIPSEPLPVLQEGEPYQPPSPNEPFRQYSNLDGAPSEIPPLASSPRYVSGLSGNPPSPRSSGDSDIEASATAPTSNDADNGAGVFHRSDSPDHPRPFEEYNLVPERPGSDDTHSRESNIMPRVRSVPSLQQDDQDVIEMESRSMRSVSSQGDIPSWVYNAPLESEPTTGEQLEYVDADLYLSQTADEIPPILTPRAMCNDASVGYEALVGPCSDINYHYVYLTMTRRARVPMVVDGFGECQSTTCSQRDKWVCCRKRRRCTQYVHDVANGCEDGKVVNQYKYAFCRTMPCTDEDADICCIPGNGQLYERITRGRAFTRTSTSMSSPPADPPMSFGLHDVAWFGETRAELSRDNVWAPLRNFMDSWGEGMGWRTPAYVRVQIGQHVDFRELKLQVHDLTCETTLDDLPHFDSEIDTYIVSCPKFCFGKPVVRNGHRYYRWKINRNKLTRKGIPLHEDRDSSFPSIYMKHGKEDIFFSEAVRDTPGNRVWVRINYEDHNQIYWMPTVAVVNGEVQSYVDQTVPEVKGCGGAHFYEREWFTSDSPICVAARTLNMFGGESEYYEISVGPPQKEYRGCRHGGIQTASLLETWDVQRSFRIAEYGTEAMRKSGSRLERAFQYQWAHRHQGIADEGPVRMLTKFAFKGNAYWSMVVIAKCIKDLLSPWENTNWDYLIMAGFILFRPLISYTVSVTIDFGVDYFFPRVLDFFTRKLDLGPSLSDRNVKLERLSTALCKEVKYQCTKRNYGVSFFIETLSAGMSLLEIDCNVVTAVIRTLYSLRIIQTEFQDRLRWHPRREPEITVGVKDGTESGYSVSFVDFSVAFITELNRRIFDLFANIAHSTEYSRLDVFGWMAGIDISKVLAESDEDFEAAIKKRCVPPNCILDKFEVKEDGGLKINAAYLPILADNLGMDWELRSIDVNQKHFEISECNPGELSPRACECGDAFCAAGQVCLEEKCVDSETKPLPCKNGEKNSVVCQCGHEICDVRDVCNADGFCQLYGEEADMVQILYFALRQGDAERSSYVLQQSCGNPEDCETVQLSLENVDVDEMDLREATS